MIDWTLYEKKIKAKGESFKERQINSIKGSVSSNFDDILSHKEAYKNSATETTPIQVLEGRTDDIKTILMQPDDNINAGDIFNFDGFDWLCVSANKTNPINESGIVFRCTYTIPLYKNGILYKVPLAVESGIRLYQLGESENKYFPEPSTVVTARLPQNDITNTVARGQIYTIGKNNWEIIDVNDIIEPNIIILKLEWTAKEPDVPPEPQPTQPIEIIGQNSIMFGNSATYTVDYSEEIVFSLEGEFATIESQNNNQCVVKAGNVYGYVTLKATSGDTVGTKQILIRSIF